MERLNHPNPTSSVSLSTSVVKLSESGTIADRQWFTFPVYSLAGIMYVHFVAPNADAPDSTTIQNYGKQITSAEGIAQLNVGENMDIYAVLSTGTFTAYPTEWQ